MKKEKINNLKNYSKLLIIVSGIMLFLLVIFISYSIFGNGKGTYSAAEVVDDVGVPFENCYASSAPSVKEWYCTDSTHHVVDVNSGQKGCCPNGYSFGQFNSKYGCYYDTDNSKYFVPVQAKERTVCSSGQVELSEGHCCNKGDLFSNQLKQCCKPSSEVTISFHSNNGVWSDQSGSPVKTVKCTIESGKSKCSPKSLPSGTVSKSGFDFKGWGEKGNCESGFTSASAVVVDKDITYYACWKDNGSSGSGSGSSDDSKVPRDGCYVCGNGNIVYLPKNSSFPSDNCNKSPVSEYTGSVPGQQCTKSGGSSADDSKVPRDGCYVCGNGNIVYLPKNSLFPSDNCNKSPVSEYTGSVPGQQCTKSGGSSGGTTTSCTYKIAIPSGASPSKLWHSSEYTYSGEVYLNKDSSSSTGNGGLRKYVIPPTGKCFTDNWTVTFANGSTKTYSQYISSTAGNGTSGDCDITLTPNFTTCSSGSGDDTPTSCKVTLDANGGSFTNVNGCGSTYTYKDKIYFSSTLNSCVKNGDKCVTGWKVIDGNNKGKTYTSSIDQTDCGSKLQAQWGSCSGSGSGTGTTDAVYSEKINEDRCSNGKWVRVASCQPTSVKDAKCKLSDDTIVDRSTIMNSRSGCEILGNAYENVINDYRCNMVTGKWIYITSCQARSVIGAHCKYASGNVIRTDLSDGAYCSDPKPSTGSNDKTQQDVDKSAPTGTLEVVIAWAIGIIALFVSFYYFKKNKTVNN